MNDSDAPFNPFVVMCLWLGYGRVFDGTYARPTWLIADCVVEIERRFMSHFAGVENQGVPAMLRYWTQHEVDASTICPN